MTSYMHGKLYIYIYIEREREREREREICKLTNKVKQIQLYWLDEQ